MAVTPTDPPSGKPVGHVHAALLGALGGLLAGLLANPLDMLDQFTTAHESLAAWRAGLLMRLALMTGLGALIIHLYDETHKLKSLQLGATAPAALSALLMVSNIADAQDPADLSSRNPTVAGFLGRALKPKAVEEAQSAAARTDKTTSAEIQPQAEKMVALFPGSSRRDASAALVSLYGKAPDAVVTALTENVKPLSNYRTNLYIAYTLRRIPGGWYGTSSQLQAIKSLRESSNYSSDETFKTHVDAAIANWREIR